MATASPWPEHTAREPRRVYFLRAPRPSVSASGGRDREGKLGLCSREHWPRVQGPGMETRALSLTVCVTPAQPQGAASDFIREVRFDENADLFLPYDLFQYFFSTMIFYFRGFCAVITYKNNCHGARHINAKTC